MTEPRVSRRRTELALVFAIIALLFLLLVPAIQQKRNSPRSECQNNLKQILLALHNYHDSNGSFPPAIVYGPDGTPWHSWRTLLLPYLEQPDLYESYRFDEPWNGPHNRELTKKVGTLKLFHCPADEYARPGDTSYVAVIGEGTMWPPRGVATLDDTADVDSPTLLVVEVSDSGVPWIEPRDLRLDAMSLHISPAKGVGIRSHHGGEKHVFAADVPPGARVGFADGSVRFLDSTTPPDDVRSMLLRNEDEP